MELLLNENRKIGLISNLTVLTVKRSFNLKKKSIYWSSHFRNIHCGINIFHHRRRYHDHCIQCSCYTELIECEVIRKLLKDMNSKEMLLWFMSSNKICSIQLVKLFKPIPFSNYNKHQKNKSKHSRKI